MGEEELKKPAGLSEIAVGAGEALKNAMNISKQLTPSFQDMSAIMAKATYDPNLASEFYKRLIKWINDFDSSLDQDHEVGIRLVNFGQTVTFHLAKMGFWNPSLISFSGYTEQGEPVKLIQHISQISILLLKAKRQDPSKPKQRIGFFKEENTPKE